MTNPAPNPHPRLIDQLILFAWSFNLTLLTLLNFLNTNNGVFGLHVIYICQIISRYRDKSSLRTQIFTINPHPGLIPSKVFAHLDDIPSKTSVISNPGAGLNIGTMLEKRRANIISRLSSANGIVAPKGHVPLFPSFHFQLEKLLFHGGNRGSNTSSHTTRFIN